MHACEHIKIFNKMTQHLLMMYVVLVGIVVFAVMLGGPAAGLEMDTQKTHLAPPSIHRVVTAGALSDGTYLGSDATPTVAVVVPEAGYTLTLYLDNCTNAISPPTNISDSADTHMVDVTTELGVGTHTIYARYDNASHTSACSAETVTYNVIPPTEAVYRVVFKGAFTKDALMPGVVIPGGAHFTTLIGGVHNAGVSFWEVGGLASPGTEGMAELGTVGTLRSEVVAARPHTSDVIEVGVGFGVTPSVSFEVEMSGKHALMTLATMIAPSPDWFAGVSGMPLLQSDGSWRDHGLVELFPYDAGTENGDGFSLNNDDTTPHQAIMSIRDMGKFLGGPIATLQFERIYLVSNLAQESSPGSLFVGHTPDGISQAFHTGPDTNGYVLYSLTAGFDSLTGSPDDIRISIASDDSGVPKDLIGTLHGNNPVSRGYYTFATDDGIRLDADTTYHVVFSVDNPLPGNAYRLMFTASDAEDAGTASGWTIADTLQGSVHDTYKDNAPKISIHGDTATTPVE